MHSSNASVYSTPMQRSSTIDDSSALLYPKRDTDIVVSNKPDLKKRWSVPPQVQEGSYIDESVMAKDQQNLG